MKIGFFVFTGTGNTVRVCNILADELQANGADPEIILIQDSPNPDIVNNYDKIVIANPVHGFNTPMPMLDFLNSLNDCSCGKSVYLVRVSGEALSLNNAAGIVPKRILSKKGYIVKGEFMYVMPYNIIFHHTNNMASRMNNAAKQRAIKDAKCIMSDCGELDKNGAFNRIVSFVCRAEHVAMPLMGRHYRVTDDCIGCGLCEKICPTKNIQMKDNKPIFNKSCVGCMACAFNCPKDAIRISLLNGWRVNGAYNFNDTPATDEEVCNYCKKSYLKYFHASENGYDDMANFEAENEQSEMSHANQENI